MSKKLISLTGVANVGKYRLGKELSEKWNSNMINGNIYSMVNNFPVTLGLEEK